MFTAVWWLTEDCDISSLIAETRDSDAGLLGAFEE